MAGGRQPIQLVQANGRKHLTKAEIQERLDSEPEVCTDEIAPPSNLTKAQNDRFVKLARQLQKIRIMGETDCETLARYVVAQDLYEQAVKDLRAAQRQKPKGEGATMVAWDIWLTAIEKHDKRVERYMKQASTLARDLGLTISSRCKLVVPKSGEEEKPKGGKFAAFGKAAN